MELSEKIVNWKVGMEVKRLKMNIGKTKVTFGRSTTDTIEEQDKWPCGVCNKRVRSCALVVRNGCINDAVA